MTTPGSGRAQAGDRDPIAIVGIGARFAKADDLQSFWQLTLEGKDTFTAVPPDRWEMDVFFDENPRSRDKSYAPTGAFIDDVRSFPAVALTVPPRRVEVMDPQQRLTLECALQAVEDSGRNPEDLPRRTGVYMGVTALEYRVLSSTRIMASMMATGALGKAPEDTAAFAEAVGDVLAPRPFTAPGTLGNMIAATVAQELALHGPAFTTDAACSSALVALLSAVSALRAGDVDAALCGGVYINLTPEHHIAFSRIGAISKSGVCRPFDARGDGFVQGDGCGVVMLKRYSDAVRDGDRIYSLIHGIASNNDGGSTGPMAPVLEGQVEVVQSAWEDAARSGVSPEHLGYIEAHGTGTLVGDKIEFTGLNTAIGGETKRAALGSSKGNFGHTMSAAGVLGLIRATMAIHRKTIPPMAGFEAPKDDVDLASSPFWIPTAVAPWDDDQRLACVSAFGFGGTNVHVVIGNAPDAAVPAEQAELVLMSGATQAELRKLAGHTAEAIDADATATLAGVARAWSKRRRQPARVAVVAKSKADLVAKLREIGRGGYPAQVAFGTVEEGAPQPKVAFMYPGQGAQRVDMLSGARDRFPVIAETLDAMDAAVDGVMERPVTHLLYPERRPEGLADLEAAFEELTETKNCQPALFSVGYALTKLLEQVGVKPAVVAGHSVGEFTAAAVAGVTSPDEGVRWTARRGAAMSAVTGDTGAMAAIVADRATIEKLLVPGAVIANVNHPRQIVLSGATDAIEEVVRRAEAKELKAVVLRVSHGFHSPVFADLDLTAEVDAIPMANPTVPVASCIQTHHYADADEARQVFKDHATSPVLWTDTVEQMQAAGAEVFLQVCAGGPLVSFMKGALPGNPNVLTIAGKEDADGGASVLDGLGQLWVRGVEMDLDAITAPAALASVPPLVLPREVYWVVKEGQGRAGKLDIAVPSGKAAAAKTATVEEPAAEAAPQAPTGGGTAEIVMNAVARASAYPREALRPDMKLGDDLGFDSMMVADLAEELSKAIAGFTGIPQEILINSPTIADIIAFADDPSRWAGADAGDDDAPLGRFGLRWVETPLPTLGERELPGGKMLVRGEGLDGVVAALEAKGYQKVSGGAVDLVVYGAPQDEPVGVDDVMDGREEVHDHAGTLIRMLDAQARLGLTPDVLVIRRDDDPWAEALTGVVRAVAREWPTAVVKSIRCFAPDPARVVAELATADRSADVRFVNGTRLVLGTKPLDAAEKWVPTADDVVLVTGGTRGIGRALGLELAEAGARVLLVGRTTPADAPQHERVTYLNADVRHAEQLQSVLAGQRVTAIVHSAGVLADGALGTVDEARGQVAREVKVWGLFNAVNAAGPSLQRVVAIGSWAGRFGNAHQAHYAAANALMAEVVQHLPGVKVAVPEFGPWTNSEMVQSIPAAVQSAMRADGVDFVGDRAGLDALLEELDSGAGPVVRGRHVPPTTRRGVVKQTLSTETHPYLLDHAIAGVPVLPLAGAATLIAEAAAVRAPFEVTDLTLYQGVTVSEPLAIEVAVAGDKGELKQGPKGTLSYKAGVREVRELPEVPEARDGGAAPAGLTLAEFYGGITFHGPLLQGIASIDAVGDDFVRGTVRCAAPASWIPGTEQQAWAIDPLAFDSAMQLTAYVAYTRYGRAGTPVGFSRFTTFRPFRGGEVLTAEAHFGEAVEDKFSATLVFRDAQGAVVALAEGVTAQMVEVKPAQETQAAPASAAPEAVAEAPVAKPAQDDAKAFEVKPEWVDPSKWKGYKDLAFRLQAVGMVGLKNPYFDVHDGTARNTTFIEGREIINYSSYNYLGLSGDERVFDAVNIAMRKYGTSVSASRIASGERPFHKDLEQALAKAQGVEDAVVMAGGHATNINTIGHLFGPKDLILHDELIHDSCLQGIKLSGAARRGFRHEDQAHLEQQLKELRPHYEKVLILVEGVYSMDGDIANLPEYLRLKKQYGCMLMVDEAHSFGTIGSTGYGLGQYWEEQGLDFDKKDVDIWMGTMSKSLAAMGGWVAGRNELMTYLRYTTPGFVFAAGIPPTLGVAALTSLQLWSEETWRVKQLHDNCQLFYELCQQRGLDNGPSKGESPVIPIITGDSMHALKLSQRLLDDHGINAKPIIFPAVANDAARLRFFLTTLHTPEQLEYTVNHVADALEAIRAGK
ncbi:MAG: aminotransferase class I/II-fold pyridoxal phosphate-dependent enzyme [Deltaproteobacteria bacterium]|nr:MAG: aminotransferase class I/II-fold pyridoxal phosphate-dependent enzyme [Deltaproteobacteria bacterium]